MRNPSFFMLRIISIIAIHVFLLSPSQAILDVNNNGLSDIWEKQQNNGYLFANTFLASNDEDNDKWTNAEEAAAGTNPFNANPPDGIVALTITPSLIQGAFTLSWNTIYEKKYQLQASTDLNNWLNIGGEILDPYQQHSIGVNTTQPDNSIPDKVFWRVQVSDYDYDSDGLTNAEESALGTDPNLANTISGIPDHWLAINLVDLLLVSGTSGMSFDDDVDQDGLTLIEEYFHQTNPSLSDSDGDMVDDVDEINNGGDPNDASDGGLPPAEALEEVPFKVGGDYASWRMEIKPLGPTDFRKSFHLVSHIPGNTTEKSFKLRRNNRYEITLHRTGGYDDWYCWEAQINGLPQETTFEETGFYSLTSRNAQAKLMMIAKHWIVDNRDGLLTTHLHSYGADVAGPLTAQLYPIETVIGDAQEIEDAEQGFVVAEAVPRPSVEMNIVSSNLVSGNLQVRLEGTVIDALSNYAMSANERPQFLYFYHEDTLLHTIAIDGSVGEGFAFDEIVTIPNANPISYVIRAETSENNAGEKAYDESAISLVWTEMPSAFPILSAPLSISFTQAPSDTAVDDVTVFVGNGTPQMTDTEAEETEEDSLIFEGNLVIPAQPANVSATCQLRLRQTPLLSATEVDTIVIQIEYTAPGFPKNKHYGIWVESAVNSLIFRPGSWVFGNQVLTVEENSLHDLRGTQPSALEACTVRLPEIPEAIVQEGLQLVSDEIAYDLINKGGKWYPEDPDALGEIKRFVPSTRNLPNRLEADSYDPQIARLTFSFRFPDTADMATEDVLTVPGEEIEEEEPPTLSSRIYSQGNPSQENISPWQPGQAVIPEHVIWAYRFINADDDFAIELLDGYLRGGHKIETSDIYNNLDLDVQLNNILTHEDNIWTIQIEEDENPIYGAKLLFEGLKEASAYDEVNSHYEFQDLFDDIEAFKTAINVAVQKSQTATIAAAELYLSAIGIVNEGLDWIIIVNDVSEGHYESIVGALPFVPVGLVKVGGRCVLKNSIGEAIDTLDQDAFLALREFGLNGNLSTAGTVFDEYEFSQFLRKSLTSDSGPVKAPTNRGGLKAAMESITPRPSDLHEAHHDFPWSMKDWFAEHGIDVNNPAYGRWVKKEEHRGWHGFRGGEFNDWWRAVEADEKALIDAGEALFTKQEIIQKLIECRQQFPDTP